MLPRAAMYSFAFDFMDEQNLDTVDQVLGKLPEFYEYLKAKNLFPDELTFRIFEDWVRRGWVLAQQEYGHPQARLFRQMRRQGGF
jgi:hypothetical protein